jgi:hypothetical protein
MHNGILSKQRRMFSLLPPCQFNSLADKFSRRSIDTLSNLFLAQRNAKIGAFAGTRESPAVAGKFFTTDYAGAGTVSFHAVDETHQLGLSGKNGLLQLVDLVNPSANTIPKDTPTEWSVFTIGQGGEVGVKDGSTVQGRKFVTWLDTDGVYYVGLWDGEFLFFVRFDTFSISANAFVGVTPQPRTVANITLIAQKTDAPK